MYYLQSRYYDPTVGRFINADGIEWLGTDGRILETNIFVYCKNNCTNKTDAVGCGGVDALLNALNKCIEVIANIIDMIGNSFNKELKALEPVVKRLTKKQSRRLSNIKTLQKQSKTLSDKLGWFGDAITFLGIVLSVSATYAVGKNIDHALIDLAIESAVAVIEWGAGELFKWIAKFIPYVGFLLALVAGWLVSYFLEQYFNDERMKRIKAKFSASVKNIRVTLVNWIREAVRCLNA